MEGESRPLYSLVRNVTSAVAAGHIGWEQDGLRTAGPRLDRIGMDGAKPRLRTWASSWVAKREPNRTERGGDYGSGRRK